MSAKPYRFAVLACSASKLHQPAKAKDLYVGALFVLAHQYAELVAESVLILSAKHGVVDADRVLEPYDLQLPKEKHRREQWGGLVSVELQRRFGIRNITDVEACRARGREVLCLAPQSYVSAIGFMYGIDCWARPLKGLGIGQQKRRLAELVREAKPGPTLSAMVLELDRAFAGDPDAPFEVPGSTWAKLVGAAKREAA